MGGLVGPARYRINSDYEESLLKRDRQHETPSDASWINGCHRLILRNRCPCG